MDDFSQQLEREIMKKNMILNLVNQNNVSDKEQARDIEMELDELLYKYYKLLRYKKN